jgi:hypothetical protein
MRAFLLVFAIGCHDYEVRVLEHDESPPNGWNVMRLDEVHADGTCAIDAGKVAFKRPKYTTNLATLTCYTDGRGREIAVSVRLPDEAWSRAGWKRSSHDREQVVRLACRGGKPR